MSGFQTHIGRFFFVLLSFFFQYDAIAQKVMCPYHLHIYLEERIPHSQRTRAPSEITQTNSEITQPISGAEIFIESIHRKTYSDDQGLASLENLCDSSIELEISANGFHHHITLIAKSTLDSATIYIITLFGDTSESPQFLETNGHLPTSRLTVKSDSISNVNKRIGQPNVTIPANIEKLLAASVIAQNGCGGGLSLRDSIILYAMPFLRSPKIGAF